MRYEETGQERDEPSLRVRERRTRIARDLGGVAVSIPPICARDSGQKPACDIRLAALDLADIHVRAAEEGIPYQTLMASVLHKFVTSRLHERTSSLTSRSRRMARKRTAA